MVLRLSLQHRLDFILTVPGAQRSEPNKAFLPLAFYRRVLATLHLIALLLQLLQKHFVILRLLRKDCIDDFAQAVTVAFFGWVDNVLLAFPVGLPFNDGQLVL